MRCRCVPRTGPFRPRSWPRGRRSRPSSASRRFRPFSRGGCRRARGRCMSPARGRFCCGAPAGCGRSPASGRAAAPCTSRTPWDLCSRPRSSPRTRVRSKWNELSLLLQLVQFTVLLYLDFESAFSRMHLLPDFCANSPRSRFYSLTRFLVFS